MDEQHMLEYIFFNEKTCRSFLDYLQNRGIRPLKQRPDKTDVEGQVVCLPDNLDDRLSGDIENFYDRMMGIEQSLVAGLQGDEDACQVGVSVMLSDGRSVLASVNPEIVNRILSVISHQQLGELVDSIVDAVENPDLRPLCKRS